MSKLLVIVDMQNDFITGPLGSKEAQVIVSRVVDKVKNWNGPIITTFDTHTEKEYIKTIEGKKLPIKHCIKDTEGWFAPRELSNAYLNKDNVYTIRKETFGDTYLFDTITNIQSDTNDFIDEIEVIGLCTDICVISNALILRSGYQYKNIVIDASCCAGTTPEKHKAAIEVMKSCLIDVINE